MKAVIDLAKSINAEIVAEGIETKGAYEQLKTMHVQYGQKNLFAKPSEKLGNIHKNSRAGCASLLISQADAAH